jgi:hypothetical protein
VKAVLAERKGVSDGGRSSGPRVIVTRMSCSEDKSSVMKVKSSLRNHSQYSKVYIHDDQSKEERTHANNLKKIIDSMKSGKFQNLDIRGSRVTVKSHRDSGRENDRNNHDRNGESEQNNRYNEKTY